MGNSSKSNFLHQQDLVFWNSHDQPDFLPLYPLNCQESSIFMFFFCKKFTLCIFRKNFENLTVNQTSTGPHISVQIFCTSKWLLCGLALLGGRNECPWFLRSLKTPKSFLPLISVNSISSTMQDILLKKSIELKLDGRKSFTQRQRNSPVTWPSKPEIGPRPTL